PINLDPGWLGAFAPYTSTKYAMTLLSLGFQQEVANRGVQVRTLWPATLIATAAVGMTAGEAGLAMARKPAIMADAAYALLTECERFANEVCWLDETALRHIGVTEFDGYANDPSQAANIQRDFYVGTF
ncbi:MAG: short chain dehydrogenase, partial [Paraperlucidibaca sp.]|nr:short chain dehydrogenase [Paraperlucidibaca sp.]